jgi:hypothetical protein
MVLRSRSVGMLLSTAWIRWQIERLPFRFDQSSGSLQSGRSTKQGVKGGGWEWKEGMVERCETRPITVVISHVGSSHCHDPIDLVQRLSGIGILLL